MTHWDQEAFSDGVLDYANGSTIDDNPFDLELEPFQHDSWEEGWIKASNSTFGKRMRGEVS